MRRDVVKISTRLEVSVNGRYLQYADGHPFFYLADTAWELFHRLNREDVDYYLRDRKQKGFTVIQAVILAEIQGLTVPNALGDLPLQHMDPAQPNERYFQYVDDVVHRAEELGLYMAMLPTWGSYWKEASQEPAIFDQANAKIYGRFLGKRFKDRPVIWVLGGDRNAVTCQERSVIEAMAGGLTEGDDGEHLRTYHPMGPGRSSESWPSASWLDFHMFQSSHGSHNHDTGLFSAADYRLEPPKPTLDGEPRYETMPVGFYFQNADRHDRFDDFDVRQAAYWSLLGGACGHTYGNNNIWQMWTPERSPLIGANIPWYEAVHHPGARQMGYLARLFTSRPFHRLIPDQGFVMDGPGHGGAKIRAAKASDSSFAFVYSPYGEAFTVNKGELQASSIKEIWYDPRYGVSYPVLTSPTGAFQTYTPPTRGRGNDWILILEDAEAGFSLPEQRGWTR